MALVLARGHGARQVRSYYYEPMSRYEEIIKRKQSVLEWSSENRGDTGDGDDKDGNQGQEVHCLNERRKRRTRRPSDILARVGDDELVYKSPL